MGKEVCLCWVQALELQRTLLACRTLDLTACYAKYTSRILCFIPSPK